MYSTFFSMGVAELPQILLQRALYIYTYTALFTFQNFTLHSAMRVWESHQSVVNENQVRHQSENSSASRRLKGIKHYTPRQFIAKQWLWQTCQHVKQATNVLPPGKRAGRLKIKGRKFQYQSVDSDVEHGIFFIFMFYLGRVNLSEGKKKPCFT